MVGDVDAQGDERRPDSGRQGKATKDRLMGIGFGDAGTGFGQGLAARKGQPMMGILIFLFLCLNPISKNSLTLLPTLNPGR